MKQRSCNSYFTSTPNSVNSMQYAQTVSPDRNETVALAGDTTTTILASSVASASNANTVCCTANICATASSGIVTITAPSGIGTVIVSSNGSGTVTETIVFSGNLGDSFTITAYDPSLPGGQSTATYAPC